MPDSKTRPLPFDSASSIPITQPDAVTGASNAPESENSDIGNADDIAEFFHPLPGIHRPWRECGPRRLQVCHEGTGALIANCGSDIAAERVAACLNVFEGVPTGRIEALGAAIKAALRSHISGELGDVDRAETAALAAARAGLLRDNVLSVAQFETAIAIAEGRR